MATRNKSTRKPRARIRKKVHQEPIFNIYRNTSLNFFRRFASHKRVIFTIFVLLLLLGIFFFNRFKGPVAEETYIVKRKSLVEGFTANGEVKANESVNLKFLSAGKVTWLGAREGEYVTAGQVLAKQDQTVLHSNYKIALNNYRNAEAQADAVLDRLQGHEEDETFAMIAERTAAEVARDNAYEQLIQAQNAIEFSTITTPLSGTVTETNNLTEGVRLTNPDLESKFIRVVDQDSFYFEAAVDEIDFPKLKNHQWVNIVFDAYPKTTCRGMVEKISEEGEEELGGVITIPTKVKLVFCFVDLAAGFNGQATFIESKRVNTMVIPKKYLVAKDGENFVWLKKSGRLKNNELVPVEVGTETATEVEILTGLNEGDVISFIPQS